MGTIVKQEALDSLGNHEYLEKQDRLREIGVDIRTSQIVVVGSQSSGKSSLLENLTGLSFPRGQGLCTRYATQITLRRSSSKKTVISIIPSSDSDQSRRDRLRAFRHELEVFDGRTLASIMEKANTAMGIQSKDSKDDTALPMFSDDILRVEISGPELPHLTVIDVPGLFQVTDQGVTELDKAKVETMVRRYMANERTIILAVMSCLSDRATEGVLQLAKAADPEGLRTIGVLTKADLVQEQAVVQTLTQLVKGDTLRLGYFIVCNRGADEDGLDISDCQAKEKRQFAGPQWAELVKLGRTGVEALRAELQMRLTELARRELPKQRAEVEQRLPICRSRLESMGPSRDSAASQREYLVRHASQFQRIVRDALDGRYEDNSRFWARPQAKLVTEMIYLNEGFSELVWKKGHTWRFGSTSGDAGQLVEEDSVEEDSVEEDSVEEEPMEEERLEYEAKTAAAQKTASSAPELHDIVAGKPMCPPLSNEPIMRQIEKCYRESRGPELGTFGGTLLAMLFKAQTSRWPGMVMTHVETAIVLMHSFIKALLEDVFVDQRMREELWNAILLAPLKEAYGRARHQAQFLLDIELNGRPSTYNHYFNDNLQKARLARAEQAGRQTIGGASKQGRITAEEVRRRSQGNRWTDELESAISQSLQNHAEETLRGALTRLAVDKSNAEQVMEDIHDILKSYYKVSRKRFVDTICRQVVAHFLLDGSASPLKVLTPELIATLSDAQLDMIAGEGAATRRERERLGAEIRGLEAAMKILRS